MRCGYIIYLRSIKPVAPQATGMMCMSVNTMNQMNDILQHPIHQEKVLHSELNPRPSILQSAHLPLHCPELELSKT